MAVRHGGQHGQVKCRAPYNGTATVLCCTQLFFLKDCAEILKWWCFQGMATVGMKIASARICLCHLLTKNVELMYCSFMRRTMAQDVAQDVCRRTSMKL